MTETRRARYGDKEMDMPDGMTLEQLKQQMARFFPELAEPEVKTEKKGDTTTYVFSKKAGRKGSSKSQDAFVRVREAIEAEGRKLSPDEWIEFLDEVISDVQGKLETAQDEQDDEDDEE